MSRPPGSPGLPPPSASPALDDEAGKVCLSEQDKGSQRPGSGGWPGGAGKVCLAGEDKSSQLSHNWPELGALGRRQDGVFGLAQLEALGFDRRSVSRMVAQGRLIRRHRGVYIDALTTATQRAYLLAALLALGPDAFLSRRTALALYGVRAVNLREIEVTIVADHTPCHPGLVVQRPTIAPAEDEIRVRDGGLRASSPSLALVEVAGRESDRELDRLVAELDRRRLLDLERIDVAIDRRRGLRGLPRLRRALGDYHPPAVDVSTLERDVAAWLAEHPEIPPPLRNVDVELDGIRWELDFHWPQLRVVAETDGAPYHRTPAELERDRVKDACLQRHGLCVLRITGFRFAHDRAGILRDLVGMMGAITPTLAPR